MNAETPPTLYEWAGGSEAFERLTAAFYEKVKRDELLRRRRRRRPAHRPRVPLRLRGLRRVGHAAGAGQHAAGANPPREAPVPRWGWGEAPPYTPA